MMLSDLVPERAILMHGCARRPLSGRVEPSIGLCNTRLA